MYHTNSIVFTVNKRRTVRVSLYCVSDIIEYHIIYVHNDSIEWSGPWERYCVVIWGDIQPENKAEYITWSDIELADYERVDVL